MNGKAAITVNRPRDEVERLWRSQPHQFDYGDATVAMVDAPGDRGTEIHVALHNGAPAGKLGEVVQKAIGAVPLAEAKDDLRRFKQLTETGVIPRSDGAPEGELAKRKLKQRPAQPLSQAELQGTGV